MPTYIYVKRKTVRWIAASTVFLIVAAVAAIVLLPRLLRKPVPMMETLSRNALVADGREVAYFRSISPDSVFTSLTLTKDSIGSAPIVHTTKKGLHAALEKTIRRLTSRIETIEGARREMAYYKEVHNVQDEGFDMVAGHDDELKADLEQTRRLLDTLTKAAQSDHLTITRVTVNTAMTLVEPSDVAIEGAGGRWVYGRWTVASNNGKGIVADTRKRIVSAVWNNDTVVCGQRTDSMGTYSGQMNRWTIAEGHGSYRANDGTFYEGHWTDGKRDGFGFAVDRQKLRAGEWRANAYRGERMQYTSERIYGIDISRYQHGKGRKYLPIHWNRLRITHLGKVGSRNASGTVDYPVSFVYVKATEGTTVRNPYFAADYRQSRRHGYRTGAYHFFSCRSSATAQANYFLRQAAFNSGDMPPVLDVEPTDEQIKQMGGSATMFSRIRTWMNIVHRRTGRRPVLYVSQRFVNKYLSQAPDIKRDYNVWIARYGEYKPDVKLVYWQLCADGRVAGITGEVDINVFNGYKDKFQTFN